MVYEILNYIKGCPYLSDFNYNVDFLGKNPYSFAVGSRSKSEIIKAYTDGDMLIKETFSLRLRLPYGVDMEKNLNNRRLAEDISRWFSENNEKRILPELFPERAISVSADFSAENASYSADTVVYTALVAVLYYKTKSH